jgi:hypothetical protein
MAMFRQLTARLHKHSLQYHDLMDAQQEKRLTELLERTTELSCFPPQHIL